MTGLGWEWFGGERIAVTVVAGFRDTPWHSTDVLLEGPGHTTAPGSGYLSVLLEPSSRSRHGC